MSTKTQAETAERPTARVPFAAPHVYLLAVVDGADCSRSHRMTQTHTVIGRGEDADFRLDDDAVSASHCRVHVEGPVCRVIDLGSRNGTRINARSVPAGTAQRLRHLDVLQVGDTKLLFVSGRYAASSNAA